MKIGNFDLVLKDSKTAVLSGQFDAVKVALELDLLKLIADAKVALPQPLAQRVLDVLAKAID